MVLKASSPYTNKPIGEDICVGHISGGDDDWWLIGEGFIGGCGRIGLDTTCQTLVVSVPHIPMVLIFWFL